MPVRAAAATIIDIVAAAFAGKNTVARHRMIYDAPVI
jgi:stress-induced morphogen